MLHTALLILDLLLWYLYARFVPCFCCKVLAKCYRVSVQVPPYLDQSEDEGFQSASNLTPDSQSEPSPSPELDVWEAIRTFEPGRRRCWERIGW